MTILHVWNASRPSAARIYHQLRERRLVELLGYWVSELEPLIFERVDVSPQVLAEFGIGAPGADSPLLTTHITVDEMIDAGVLA